MYMRHEIGAQIISFCVMPKIFHPRWSAGYFLKISLVQIFEKLNSIFNNFKKLNTMIGMIRARLFFGHRLRVTL